MAAKLTDNRSRLLAKSSGSKDPYPKPEAAKRKPLGTFDFEKRQDQTEGTRLIRVLTAHSQVKPGQDSLTRKDAFETSLLKASKKSNIVRPATLPSTKAAKFLKKSVPSKYAAQEPPKLSSHITDYLATQMPVDLEQALYQDHEFPLGHARGPSPDQATMSLLTFSSEQTHGSYAITTPEGRISSNAKRRRWATQVSVSQSPDQHGKVLACMEFKMPEERGLKLLPEEHLKNVQYELSQLMRFNRDIKVHALLRTSDGYLMALMTNLPEESSYLLERTSDAYFDSTFMRVFADAVQRLDSDIHQAGYIHGDFKLQNVMMTSNARASLIDFEALSKLDKAGFADIIGTTYAPPEQLHPQNAAYKTRFGPSGDVFAVGLAMFDAFAEREATNLNVSAQNSPYGHLLDEKAQEIRLNKEKVIYEMTDRGSAFYAWRKEMLQGGYDAQKILQDTSIVAKSLHFMAKRSPKLFEHWLTCLSSPDPADRPSLAKTISVLDEIMAEPKHRSMANTVHQSMLTIIGESMSASVAPAIEEAALQAVL